MKAKLLAGLLVWASAGAADFRLTMAVNNRAGLESGMVRGAEEIASAIFRHAGVKLVWQECNNSEARPADFRLNLVNGSAATMAGDTSALGYSA